MATFFRMVGAIVAGLGVVVLIFVGVELLSELVHPFPPDAEKTHDEICKHVARYPHWFLAVAVPLWGFMLFAGTWVAGWLGNRFCAVLLGLLLLAAFGLNIVMLPYTLWFKVVMLIVIPTAIVLGVLLSGRRKTVAATS
jgi:hypothetical protein